MVTITIYESPGAIRRGTKHAGWVRQTHQDGGECSVLNHSASAWVKIVNTTLVAKRNQTSRVAFKPLMPAWRREAETMHLEKGLHGGAAGPAQRAGHPDRECPACHRTAPASRGAARGSRHASDTASGEASDSSWFFGTMRSAAARKPASGRSQRSSSVARASTAGAIPRRSASFRRRSA